MAMMAIFTQDEFVIVVSDWEMKDEKLKETVEQWGLVIQENVNKIQKNWWKGEKKSYMSNACRSFLFASLKEAI